MHNRRFHHKWFEIPSLSALGYCAKQSSRTNSSSFWFDWHLIPGKPKQFNGGISETFHNSILWIATVRFEEYIRLPKGTLLAKLFDAGRNNCTSPAYCRWLHCITDTESLGITKTCLRSHCNLAERGSQFISPLVGCDQKIGIKQLPNKQKTN